MIGSLTLLQLLLNHVFHLLEFAEIENVLTFVLFVGHNVAVVRFFSLLK